MNIQIEIDNTNITERNVNGERGTFTVREQTGWVQLPGKRYPQEIVIQLEGGQPASPVATYQVLEDSVVIDRYKRIAFQRSLQLGRIESDSADTIGTAN